MWRQRASEWLFRLSLHLYSRAFRERYGAELESLFRDTVQAARGRGRTGALRAASTGILDVLRTAPRERWTARRPRARTRRFFLSTLPADVRQAWRIVGRNPLASLCVMATAMLGIGVVTAVATVIGSVLLRPLPLPAAERLVRVSAIIPEVGTVGSANPLDLADWREGNHSFAALAAFDEFAGGSLRHGDAVSWIRIASVDDELMRVLGIRPAAGRNFRREELLVTACAGTGRLCSSDVVIISDRLWRSHFGAADVVGRTVELDGEQREIVGVLPPLPRSVPGGAAEVWQPLRPRPGTFWLERGATWLGVVGQLRADASVEGSQTDLARISARLGQAHPRTNARRGVAVEPLAETMVAAIRPVLLLLGASVATVLLIACVNIGTLLLAGAERRAREYAVLAALGGSPLRLGRQALLETALLAGVGGSLGVLVAAPCVDLLLALYPGELPRGDEIRLDGTVLAGAAALIGFAAMAAAVPLLQRIRRIDLTRDLRGSARSTASREQRRLADVMVGVQVALSVALLFGAVLLVRAYRSIAEVDPGFRSEGVVSFRLAPAPARYPDAERRAAYFDRVLRSIRALPAVQAAGASMFLPLVSGGNDWEDRPQRAGIDATFDTAPVARIEHVTPGYFETLDIPLLRGTPVDAAATDSSFRGVWVNQAYALRAFGTAVSVGRRILWENGEPWPIVGIVGDATHGDLWIPAPPTVYFPIGRTSFVQERWIVVRTRAPTSQVLASVRAELLRIDPTVAPADIATMAERETRARAPERFRAALLGVLTCVAVVLAIVGLYSSVAVMVGRRTREIGLRLALGETRGAVRRRVLRQALSVAAAGTVVGCFVGVAGKRWLASFLAGMNGNSVPLILAVAGFLLVLAAVAASVPAARASRVDPVVALRGDS